MAERIPGAVGFIQPGVMAQIVDKSGNRLPPLHDGLLRVRSDNMASGYVGDAEATAAVFRDGFFYTGDIGHLTHDGILVITGREKTALNLGGETVTPETVEEVLVAFAGIRDAGVFAQNDEFGVAKLCALVVTMPEVDEAALLEHCRKSLTPSCVPERFIVIDSLPRGGQGKLERHRLPELAAAKERTN
jgi:acyl-CoA synthetase (AMP-forming)/AMP-acid ligase II